MTPEERDKQLIDQYIRGELSPEDQKLVADRADQDPSFKEQLGWQENLLDVIGEQKNKELKNFLQTIESDQNTENNQDTGKLRILPIWIKWSAAAVVIGVVSWWAWLQLQPGTEDLYATYFSTYPNEIVLIERSVESPNALQLAFLAYQQQNYKDAIIQFEQLTTEESNDSLSFYTAVAMMANQEPAKALPILERLIQKDDWQFTEAVRWYLALVYLETGNPQSAKALFREIANYTDGHFQQRAAREILEQL